MNNSSSRHRNLENKGIKEDNKREVVKNLVGKSKREGLGALLLKKFKKNYVWFQLVMRCYNIQRYLKVPAQ